MKHSKGGSIMKILRSIGSLAFVFGLFTTIFLGIPWHVVTATDPIVPGWLRLAIFSLLGGILVVMLTVALEQKGAKRPEMPPDSAPDELSRRILLQSSPDVPGREVNQSLGLVQGHTAFAIWLGNDLSAIVRLILGGELTEYTDMMGKARTIATQRMIAQAEEMGADAILNIRYMTTSVIGSAAELLVYGTAVKLR
jgi:uncharacterized protein YbjQ (UPF0145 family)